MTSQQPNESSIFNTARKIESADERAAFLEKTCGYDQALRQRVEKLLAAYVEESQYLEQPAEGLEATMAPEERGRSRSASLDAGLATAFSTDKAVVLGDKNHSVLKMLGQTLGSAPNVVLRDPADGGTAPITKPKSPEIPNTDSDDRYRFDGEIARGGMGAILKGRDNDLGRDLAIKVLLDSHKHNPQVVQRFVEEAQIGGQLQHPGIAPIYELGQFADQRPFFAMKLVKGETLAKLLADRQVPAAERSKFVGIFEQVCQTMAYAHSRNVIHRDLKPANIMVGAFGEVQVMDWGLAKVLPSGGVADEKQAQSKHKYKEVSVIQTRRSSGSDAPGSAGSGGSGGSDTQMGSVMGTPAYMPPEQALGEIDQLDQRADVFGLGAILCEILTGKPPYVGEDGTQVFRMASRGKLDDAFARLDDCGADTELVMLAKDCLAVEPADRPKDASVLALRVTTYLESVEQKLRETELAKVDAQVRAEELSRRQRLALTAGTAIVATLVIGISMSLWQMIRANNAEELATKEAKRATAAQLAAKEEADKATAAERKTAESLVAVAAERDAKERARKEAADISTFLTDILRSPDPTRDGREIKVAELLDNAAKKLETNLTEQPFQRAKMQTTLARTYYGLGLYREAIPLQEQVRDYLLATLGPDDPHTLSELDILAGFYHEGGHYDKAIKLTENSLARNRKEFGSEHPNTLRSMSNLAAIYFAARRTDDALKLLEQALPLSRRINGSEHPQTLSVMDKLAAAYHLADRSDEALELGKKLLPLLRQVCGPKHLSTLLAMTNLADYYSSGGHWEKSINLSKQAVTLYREVHGPEHPDTLRALSGLAKATNGSGHWREAQEMYEEALTLSQKILGEEHPETLQSMSSLATSYHDTGRLDEALVLREKELKLRRKAFDPEHPQTFDAMHNLAISYSSAGRMDEAIKLGEEVLKLRRKVLGAEHRRTLTSMLNVSVFHRTAGSQEKSLKMLEELLPLYNKVFGPNHHETFLVVINLAQSYYAADRIEESIKLLEDLLPISRQVLGREHPLTFGVINSLQYSYAKTDRDEETISLLEEMLPISRKRYGALHIQTLAVMTNLAGMYGKVGRLAEAVELQEESLALKRRALPDHRFLPIAINQMSSIYLKSGRPEKALPLVTELLEYCVGETAETDWALKVAALQAWFAVDDEYPVTRKKMLAWAAGTDDRAVADHVAKLSCLRPIEDAEARKAVLGLGQKSVTLGQDDKEALPWSHLALGMAEYRNGQFDKAANTLTIASESATDANDEDDAARISGTANFYRAMALFQQQKKDEARTLFNETAAKMKPLPTDEKNPFAEEGAGRDGLVLWLAYKEAKGLVTEKLSKTDPDKTDTPDKQPDAGAKTKVPKREN